jgi:hypothetical protein
MLHMLRSYAGLLALWAAVCVPSGRVRAETPPRIEVAFALDTTGSMGPYIQMARERIRGARRCASRSSSTATAATSSSRA